VTQPNVFILDVDGVMTTGQFLYSAEGKQFKIFGPDDSDALSVLGDYMEIRFVSSDKRGFKISESRISRDMGYRLDLVATFERFQWITERYSPEVVAYMGDGFYDHLVMKNIGYSIAPSNANSYTKSFAQYITESSGGNRAVCEACIHLLAKFFNLDRTQLLPRISKPT
jgi:3-deoxy-D-manno-octulosonate 8-phosphate phosphatase (KDO 8-P phosphatase)